MSHQGKNREHDYETDANREARVHFAAIEDLGRAAGWRGLGWKANPFRVKSERRAWELCRREGIEAHARKLEIQAGKVA